MPSKWLRYVEAFYKDNECVISVSGGLFPGFSFTAGIRQGCPLSPVLFAVVLDVFIRRILRKLPEATLWAYADDIAVVTPNLYRHAEICRRSTGRWSARPASR